MKPISKKNNNKIAKSYDDDDDDDEAFELDVDSNNDSDEDLLPSKPKAKKVRVTRIKKSQP